MTPEIETLLKKFADYFDLQIVYTDNLSDDVPGLLATNEGPIVLNARRPPLEHAFTIAHEIGHYIMHQSGKPKFSLPWFINREWKWEWVRTITGQAKAIMLEKYGIEWEADFWAFVMLLHLGAIAELKFIFESYPEKRTLYWLSLIAVALGIGKQLEKNLSLLPMRAADFLQSSLSSRRSSDD